ncbi:inorganic phosphate transporter [Rhizobium sp. SL42]|uniref:inorganic phosphate transporter n=1 Tax=Rhizobium sp. SL42 TaxID=2806346 RepID=UPI001F1ABFD2|nr:inorganic phosphate transporter [Rhizobium sp. SL42]UJW76180.1 inorganic phosphate transporter [Rhizobium sp. SL42]
MTKPDLKPPPRAQPKLSKPTLDKDLDKITYAEEAAQHLSRRVLPFGLGLVFLVLVMALAGIYVSDRPGAVIMVAAAVLGGYMAMNIGANDVTNNVGAAVGARAISIGAALAMAAVFEIAGAVIAGDTVVMTISRGILAPEAVGNPQDFATAMLVALLAAALWINLSTWLNAPVSTTHSIVGAVMGAGIAAAGMNSVNWGALAGITASWIISPLLGGGLAALFLAFIKEFILYRIDKIGAAKRWVPVLVGLMAGAFTLYLTVKGIGQVFELGRYDSVIAGFCIGLGCWLVAIPLVRRQAEGLENRNQSLRKLFRLPLVISAALLSFAHGANDVANAIGPVVAIFQAIGEDTATARMGAPIWATPTWVTLIGAFGIAVGLLLYGPRLIRLVGTQITKLNPVRAYCVALSAAVTVILASSLGLPVSSTHIAIGAVFGVGLYREWYIRNSKRRIAYLREKFGHWDAEDEQVAERDPDEVGRRRLVRRSYFITMIAAWSVTVPCSAGLAALLYGSISLIFGHI